jgi:hypothetical protein
MTTPASYAATMLKNGYEKRSKLSVVISCEISGMK